MGKKIEVTTNKEVLNMLNNCTSEDANWPIVKTGSEECARKSKVCVSNFIEWPNGLIKPVDCNGL